MTAPWGAVCGVCVLGTARALVLSSVLVGWVGSLIGFSTCRTSVGHAPTMLPSQLIR